MSRLEQVDGDLWVAEGEIVSFYGFPYPTRAAIARLADGRLWVWSPVRLDGKGLLADSLAIVSGAILGTSTTTSYVESTSGVAAGARSGFAAIVTGLLFILAIFFFPLLSVVTSAVTAPALIVVGVLMASGLKHIDWSRFEIAVPAFFTIIMMPLTYSIATGIACGFVFYPITMIMTGKAKQVHPIMYGLFVIFIAYFIFLV